MISLGIFLIGSIGAAAAWNIWSLIAWRALAGRRLGGVPLELRDHPGRVSPREGRCRDRPRLGGVRHRRRLRDRALRGDRGQRVVALAFHRGRCRDRSGDGARTSLRSGVSDQDAVARGLPRRDAHVGRPDRDARRAHRRRSLGLDLRSHSRARRDGGRAARHVGLCSSYASISRSSTCACSRGERSSSRTSRR